MESLSLCPPRPDFCAPWALTRLYRSTNIESTPKLAANVDNQP